MHRTRTYCIAVLSALLVFALLANPLELASTSGLFPWRKLLIQYTGIMAYGAMSLAMILAVRPLWLEKYLGGMDKAYRLHKWLGISAIALAVIHWLIVQGPKWMVGAGIINRPPKLPAPAQSFPVFQFFHAQRGLAEELGFWAFWTAIAIIAIALIKYFPYRFFFKSHRFLAVIYLVLVAHAVILLNFSYWLSPLGFVMAILTIGGVVAAILALCGLIGKKRKVEAQIERVKNLADINVCQVDLDAGNRWPGHRAGQFAFVTFHSKEGAHPFTISSAWRGDGRLRFLIKDLGDYTCTLAGCLMPGQPVVVEGPYGCFTFDGASRRQIWIGGGIGITPFIARLHDLINNPDGRSIDFYYTSTKVDERLLAELEQEATAAGVRLHILIKKRDGYLTGLRIRGELQDWRTADVWFCGPARLGRAILNDLKRHRYQANRFHQELFEMR